MATEASILNLETVTSTAYDSRQRPQHVRLGEAELTRLTGTGHTLFVLGARLSRRVKRTALPPCTFTQPRPSALHSKSSSCSIEKSTCPRQERERKGGRSDRGDVCRSLSRSHANVSFNKRAIPQSQASQTNSGTADSVAVKTPEGRDGTTHHDSVLFGYFRILQRHHLKRVGRVQHHRLVETRARA